MVWGSGLQGFGNSNFGFGGVEALPQLQQLQQPTEPDLSCVLLLEPSTASPVPSDIFDADQAMVMELWRQDRLARASCSAMIFWALGLPRGKTVIIFETGKKDV